MSGSGDDTRARGLTARGEEPRREASDTQPMDPVVEPLDGGLGASDLDWDDIAAEAGLTPGPVDMPPARAGEPVPDPEPIADLADEMLPPDEQPTTVDGSLPDGGPDPAEALVAEEESTAVDTPPLPLLQPPAARAAGSAPTRKTREPSKTMMGLGPGDASQDMAFKDTLPGNLQGVSLRQRSIRPPGPPSSQASAEPVATQAHPEGARTPKPTEPRSPAPPPIAPPAPAAGPVHRGAGRDAAPSQTKPHLAETVNTPVPGPAPVAQSPLPDPMGQTVAGPGPLADARRAPGTAPRPAPAQTPYSVDVPTASVRPARQVAERAPQRGPSNLILAILWVVALISVTVAVVLYVLRPSV